MIGERKLIATPDQAWEFLNEHARRIAGALDLLNRTAEKRIAELAMTGAEKYGPDDLDHLTKMFTEARRDTQEARTQLSALAPLELKDEAQMKAFAENLERLFPETPLD